MSFLSAVLLGGHGATYRRIQLQELAGQWQIYNLIKGVSRVSGGCTCVIIHQVTTLTSASYCVENNSTKQLAS